MGWCGDAWIQPFHVLIPEIAAAVEQHHQEASASHFDLRNHSLQLGEQHIHACELIRRHFLCG